MDSVLKPAPKQVVLRARTWDLENSGQREEHLPLADVRLLCEAIERLSIVLQSVPADMSLEAGQQRAGGGRATQVWDLLRPYTVVDVLADAPQQAARRESDSQ